MTSGRDKGFTLYELLITVLVGSIIFGLGVPSVVELSRNGRMAAAANDLVSALHLARSEALTRDLPISLCASPDPLAALPSCSADGSATRTGFFVWVDENRDAVADAGEEIVLRRPGTEGIDMYGDSGVVHFGTDGFVKDPSAGNSASALLFCDARGNITVGGGFSAARALRIPPTGRSSLLRTVDEIDALAIDCL